ncbi:hypothetical protein ACTMU2_04930 [Cupriavidus basilensis]
MPAFSNVLPKIGETERAALESGTVGFEGCFFEGKADFARLAAIPGEQLTGEEQAFIDERVAELCGMLDDFAIDEARSAGRSLALSARAQILRHDHSARLRRTRIQPCRPCRGGDGIASVNLAAAVTVMVPNSLGPAELLVRYGTRGTEESLSAAPGAWRRYPVFCADLPVCRLRRRCNSRYRGVDAARMERRHDRGLCADPSPSATSRWRR